MHCNEMWEVNILVQMIINHILKTKISWKSFHIPLYLSNDNHMRLFNAHPVRIPKAVVLLRLYEVARTATTAAEQSSNHQTMTTTTALNTLRTTKYTKHTLLCAAALSRSYVPRFYLNKIRTNEQKKTHNNNSTQWNQYGFFSCTVPLFSSFVAIWGGMASCRISIHSQSQYRYFLWVECNDYIIIYFLHLLEQYL